jgi:hypothetical protein
VIRKFFKITGTSPAAQGTAVVGNVIRGLDRFNWFTIDAALVGATGGTLDVYLQRQVALDSADEVTGGVWSDWIHFAQLGAGAAAVKYTLQPGASIDITAVAHGSDAAPGTPALAAGEFIGGHPGVAVRCVCVAGASTSAGGAVAIYINAFDERS